MLVSKVPLFRKESFKGDLLSFSLSKGLSPAVLADCRLSFEGHPAHVDLGIRSPVSLSFPYACCWVVNYWYCVTDPLPVVESATLHL